MDKFKRTHRSQWGCSYFVNKSQGSCPIPRTSFVNGENQPAQAVLWPLHINHGVHAHKYRHSKCNLFILRKEKKLLVQKVNDVVGYFSCQRENKVTDIYMNVLKIYFWKRISKFVLSLCYLLSFLTAITFNSSTHFKVKNNLFQSWSIMCPLQWCISKP